MGLHRRQSLLLTPLLSLVACVQPGTGLESINYTPQLLRATLEGRLTQSTFTLEQPLGQFENVNLSDPDPIWLVVAHSNEKVEDKHAPASLDRSGYYLTLRASRVHYKDGQTDRQLRGLRVGNDSSCSLESQGCNSPLPGAGPYRVKFLAMSAQGPVAETMWSNEIYLQQAQTFREAPGSQSKDTVVIIAFLSILLAILLAVFLVLVLSAWPGFPAVAACPLAAITGTASSCRSSSVSSPEEQVRMRQYHTHHMGSLRAERSS
ncbi:Uroplakin 3B-like [Apodemus speciosus]|uniref:Uroplakin 3B-like n=1 Tax=Apodemus speciosus TaxID=105296 RepID=A0ABQ0ETC9_APOSI